MLLTIRRSYAQPDCPVCSRVPVVLHFAPSDTLSAVVELLRTDAQYQLKSPSLTTADKTLYMSNIADLEEATRPNLKLSLAGA